MPSLLNQVIALLQQSSHSRDYCLQQQPHSTNLPLRGGGCSSIFVLDKLHGAEQGSKVIILRHRPLCNLLRGEGWTREPPAGNRRKSRVSSHGHPARPTGGEDRFFYRDVPGFKAQGVFREGLAGVLCHRRGDRITIGLQAMARFTPHGGTVAYIYWRIPSGSEPRPQWAGILRVAGPDGQQPSLAMTCKA